MMSGSASLANSTIGVGQLLAAIGMNISIVQTQSHKLDSAGARAISENAMLVEEVSREIRTISRLFHPPLLDLAGLVSALRWYVDGFSERRKIKVDLDIPFDFGRLPDEVEIAIFRIVQECLTNIHRHSGGATANIGLTRKQIASPFECAITRREFRRRGSGSCLNQAAPVSPSAGCGSACASLMAAWRFNPRERARL